MKFLVWAAVCVIAVMWLLRKKDSGAGADMRDEAAQPGTEAMVRCAHCGVHLPQSEAIVNPAGRPFCSEEHRLQHVTH
jgi:uncharacterized protein